MVNYRRARVPGATFFFTVTLRDRGSRVLTEHIAALRASVSIVKRERPLRIEALVVLPDHLHTIWTLPDDDADYSGRWRAIKAAFTRELKRRGVTLECDRRGEYKLWQRRYWEHLIRDEKDLARHVDYIHYNPVKHGWVTKPVEWPWSSIHQHIRRGLIPPDWAVVSEGDEFGE
jgi:putative transposase